MWATCGVVRDGPGLERGAREVEAIAESGADIDVSPNEEGWADLGHLFDLRAALTAARLTLMGADARRESRGAHQRSDHPQTEPAMRVVFEARCGSAGDVERTAVEPPTLPSHLRGAQQTPAPELTGSRLLE